MSDERSGEDSNWRGFKVGLQKAIAGLAALAVPALTDLPAHAQAQLGSDKTNSEAARAFTAAEVDNLRSTAETSLQAYISLNQRYVSQIEKLILSHSSQYEARRRWEIDWEPARQTALDAYGEYTQAYIEWYRNFYASGRMSAAQLAQRTKAAEARLANVQKKIEEIDKQFRSYR